MFNNNEQAAALNKIGELTRRACDRLREITGLDATYTTAPDPPQLTRDHTPADGILTIRPPTPDAPEQHFIVEEKRHLTTQNIEMVLRVLQDLAHAFRMPPLLIAEYINPNLTQRLREATINYLDAAGNAYLRAPALFVDIQGQRLAAPIDKPRPLGRAGLQLVTLFLAHPDYLNATTRDMADAAGVGLGTVPNTLRDLELRGLLRHAGPKQQVLHHTDKLLELWAQGYAEVLRPHLVQPRRYRLAPHFPIKHLATALQDADVQGVLVGGEAAAAIYTQYLMPAGATIHVLDPNTKLPARLLLPDAHGNVDVLRLFGKNTRIWGGPPDGLVHPLLVYGELLATGGHDRRFTETAELLREHHLRIMPPHARR